MKLALADPVAMEALGGALARQCPTGTSLFLQGELGVGKTTLVRGFLRALGFKAVVKSPTFTLVESYDLGGRRIYHFDLYRLTNPQSLEELGFRDYFDGEALALVEWSEHAAGRLGSGDILIQMRYASSHRAVVLEGQTTLGRAVLQQLSFP